MIKSGKTASLAGRGGPVVKKAVAASNYLTCISSATEFDARDYAARVVALRLGMTMPVARLVSQLAGLAVRS